MKYIISAIATLLFVPSISMANECANKFSDAPKDTSTFLEAIKCIEENSVPVGTVIPSMLPPDVFSKSYGDSWALADGRTVSISTKYYKLTNSSHIPDLRGNFIRGMNHGISADPDANRVVGGFQNQGTRLPANQFTGTTNAGGIHTHTYSAPIPYNAGAGNHQRAKPAGETRTTDQAGNHAHTVTITGGGDVETRPRNISMYFYIKVN